MLDARIRAVIRRTARAGSPAETYGELMIDRGSLIVQRNGRDVSLTPTELRLLLVALLVALASQWVVKLMLPVFPSLSVLRVLADPPKWARPMFYTRPGGSGRMHLASFLSVVFGLTAVLLLLAVITGLAFAASRPVLLPVRRLARAASFR